MQFGVDKTILIAFMTSINNPKLYMRYMKVFTGLPVDILTLHLLLINHGNHEIRVQTISLCSIA